MNKIKLYLSAFIIVLVFVFVYFATYRLAEPRAYDFMTKNVLIKKLPFDNLKKTHGSDDIVLVIVDDKTAQKYRWPWRRDSFCKIFNYFREYSKPKLLVFDFLIAAPDKHNPDSDKKFFDTLKKFDNLIVGFLPRIQKWENSDFGEIYDKELSQKFSLNVTDKRSNPQDLYRSVYPYPKAYFDSIKHIGSGSMITGFINGDIFNRDEVYRNHEYIFRYKDYFYPSFALQAYLMLNNNPQVVLTNKALIFPEQKKSVSLVRNDYQSITPVKFYELYEQQYTHKKYSAVDIMDSYEAIKNGQKPILNPEIFNNKIIVIGANVTTGTGAYDIKNTPVQENHPGADYQATAIDNILHNDFLVVLPAWFNIFATLLGMLLIYTFIRISSLYKSIANMFAIIFGYLLICTICFYFGVVINVITPIVMFVLATILAYTHKFVLENKSKEKVKNAMGKYISEDVMKRVIQNIDNLGLGGKKAVVTVLFSDIRGFTTMSEQMSAEQVSQILNEYFTEMEPIITKYNGVINKFIGDAVMAIFGEPIQDKNHPQNAVKCAFAMLEKVKELQKKWAQEGKPKIEIGIGINTGEVFVGNIGSVNRMEYTVIGDTVNLASRLESYNKTYKTKMLISSSTYEEVKGIVNVIRISDVQIRGKAHKMDIYEVLRVSEF